MTLSADTLTVLSNADAATLARWWCQLKAWMKPAGLPTGQAMTDKHRLALMCWIDKRIGFDTCLREWNSSAWQAAIATR